MSRRYQFIAFLVEERGVTLDINILQERLDGFMATYEEDSDVYMPDVFKPKKRC